MKRRNFIAGLFAIPVIGGLVAKELEDKPTSNMESATPFDCKCYPGMDCDTGLKCKDSFCLPPSEYKYVEFNVPSTRKITRMRVTGDAIREEIIMDLNRKH